MDWLERQSITLVDGALRPASYVARAVRYVNEHDGQLPAWARKGENGHWQFASDYIAADALKITETISVSEAATLVGATRRAVQTWVDEGVVPCWGERTEGDERRIPRKAFTRLLPRLVKRLQTAQIIGQKIKRGLPVPEELAKRNRVRAELKNPVRRRAKRRKQDSNKLVTEDIGIEELKRQTERAEKQAKRLLRERKVAEKKMRAARTAEERLAAALDRRIAAAMSDLQVARQDRRRIVAERRQAEQQEKQLAKQEQETSRRAAQLKDAVQGRAKEEKEQQAADIEALFMQARVEREKESAWEDVAIQIAERISNAMFDEEMSRLDALRLYNSLAKEEFVPRAVRVAVRKRFFGR